MAAGLTNAGKRADLYSMAFMEEVTGGEDPGIVAAAWVDGTETVPYAPLAGDAKKAFISLQAAPSDLPKQTMVEIPRVNTTRYIANPRVAGLKSEGEFTVSIPAHGWFEGGTPTTRPYYTPWLHLMASATGRIVGQEGTTPGGAPSDIDTATSTTDFSVLGNTIAPGHVLAVKDLTAGVKHPYDYMRPITVGTDATADDQVAAALWPLDFTPAPADEVYHSAQAHFDQRENDNSPCFTILLARPVTDSSQMFHGCRVTKLKLNTKVGEVPSWDLTFTFTGWSTYSDSYVTALNPDPRPDITTSWAGFTGSFEEPDYFATAFPLAEILKCAKFITKDTTGNRKDPYISEFTMEWDAGMQKLMSPIACEGVAATVPTGEQVATAEWKVPYDTDYRGFIGQGEFPFLFAFGSEPGKMIYVHMAAARLKEDPGFSEEMDGNQAQKIMVDNAQYLGDTGDFAEGSTIDNILAIGVI